MNTFFEKYKALVDALEKKIEDIVRFPQTPLQTIGQIIVFFIVAVVSLLVLSFAGLFQDPTGIFIPH